jgi:O-antigen ligase
VTRERLTFGHGGQRPVLPAGSIAAVAGDASQPRRLKLPNLDAWDWGWGGLLIFTVLLFFRPQDQLPGLKNSHISDIAAIIGLVAMFSANVRRRLPFTRLTPELLGVLGFGLVIILTIPTSIWPGGALGEFQNNYLPIALIYLLAVNTLTTPKRIERLVWIIVLAFGFIAARVMIDYFIRGIGSGEGRAQAPVGGFFQNPNDLALNLVVFLPFVFMYIKRPGPAMKRLLCLGIAFMMMVVIVLTRSRGGTLGFVAMFATFLIVARLLTPTMIIAGMLSGVFILPALPDSFWARMSSITDASKDDTGSREERRLLLIQGWKVFLERPLTGVGAGQFKNYWHPGLAKKWHETHNMLLQVASETGVFGLILFSFLIWRGFSAAAWIRRHLRWIHQRRPKRKPFVEPEDGLTSEERSYLHAHGTAMMASMVGWFVCAMFASVALNWTFYYLLALGATARDVMKARSAAYAKAKKTALREASAA